MDERWETSWRVSLTEYMKFCLDYCRKYTYQVTWVVTTTLAFLASCLPFIGFFSLLLFLMGAFLAVPLALFFFSLAFMAQVQDLAPKMIRPLLGFLIYMFLSIFCKTPGFYYITDEQNKVIPELVLNDQNCGFVNADNGQILRDWNGIKRGSEEEIECWDYNEMDSEEEIELDSSSSSSLYSTNNPFSFKRNYDQVDKKEAGCQQFDHLNSWHTIFPCKAKTNMKKDGLNWKESMRLRQNYNRELRALRHTPLSEYKQFEPHEDGDWRPAEFHELLEYWRKKERNWI